MRVYPKVKTKKSLLSIKLDSFSKGLNKLVSPTQLRGDELSDAVDVQLIEDGKVQCPRDGQSYYGSTSGSKVTGLTGYYKANGTRELVRMCGTTLQKYNVTSGDWDNISGFTYTTSLDADMVTAYDSLYICNGTDALTTYAGSTVSSFSTVGAPTISSVTRTGGSSGTYTFSYKVTSVSAYGESLPSAASTQTVNQDTLSSSVYMTVAWSAVPSAVGYNVYGNKGNHWYFMKYVEGNGSVSYADKAVETPLEYILPPTEDTSGGPIGKYVASYKDTLFIFGNTANPSRLYYSGGGDKLTDFSAANGGGFVDISKNDGTMGTGILSFKNILLVFKEDSLFQFSFTSSGLPEVVMVSSAVGAISRRSIIIVENDVFFVSRRGVFTVGNEQGFTFDTLRTNEVSARVRPLFQAIETSRLDNISAIYATKGNANLAIFAYTPTGGSTNSKALVFDRERISWYEWSNIKANCWVQYVDSSGATHVLYGDDSSGYVKEILDGGDDFGTAIHGYFSTVANDFDALNVYKTSKDLDIILRNPTGSITLSVIVDGVVTALTVPISTLYPSVSWGHYLFTDFLLGESVGTGSSSQDDNVLRTKRNTNIEGRSFMLTFDNNSSGNFVLLEADMTAKARSLKYRHSEDVIS